VENGQNYNIGGVPFEDMKCWFLQRTDETFKCTICYETFPSKSNFMLHRKQHHSEMAQECKMVINVLMKRLAGIGMRKSFLK